MFFVLSGYFVGGPILQRPQRFAWRQYAINRLSRLWVVLLPALAFTAGVDAWTSTHVPHVLDGAHASGWQSFPEAGVLDHSWRTALGNALFLQTAWTPVFGSNGPLWSLACEAWYYLAFPLLVQGVTHPGGPLQRGWRLLAALALLALMPHKMLALFPVWVCGALIALPTPRAQSAWPLRLATLAFLCTLLASRLDLISPGSPRWSDVVLGVLFAGWCLAVKTAPLAVAHGGTANSRVSRAIYQLSDMSYSLYVIHMPLVFAAAGLISTATHVPPTAGNLGWFAISFMCIMAITLLFWALFERHAPAVRRALTQRLNTPALLVR